MTAVAWWLSGKIAGRFGGLIVGLAGALVALLLVTVLVLALALAGARTDAAEAREQHSHALAIQATNYAQQVELAKADYEEQVAGHMAAYDTLTKELHDAQDRETALAARLRSGAVRVRRELCEARSVPGTKPAASAGVDGRRTPDGADLAAAAVGAGDTADARLKACIAIAKADRRGR